MNEIFSFTEEKKIFAALKSVEVISALTIVDQDRNYCLLWLFSSKTLKLRCHVQKAKDGRV